MNTSVNQAFFREEQSLTKRMIENWESKLDEQPSIDKHLKETAQFSGSLKKRLDFALKCIDVQLQKLDQGEDKFCQKYKIVLKKISEAYTKHETTCACVFAYDLVEIRKIALLIVNSKLVLQQIAFRLQSITEVSALVSVLAPCVAALETVKSSLVPVFPETEYDLDEISDLLKEILVEAGKNWEIALNSEAIKEELNGILSEATIGAKERIKEKFL